MGPKFDPNAIYNVVLKCRGGEAPASASLAPKISPLGVNPKAVGEQIANLTKDFKNIRVTVKITIQNRKAEVAMVPSASSLIIKALNEPPRDRKKVKNIRHSGNISLDDVIDIARQMRCQSMAINLVGTVTEILGTCTSIGCTVENKHPHEVTECIKEGSIAIPTE